MSDMNLRAQVEVVLKDHGLLEVNQRLKTTEDRLKSTSTAATTAGAGFGALATRLAGAAAAFISIGSALRFVDSSVTQFAKLDRQLRALAIQMDAMGISSKDALPEVRKFLEAIEASGGATLDQTVPAFQKYLGLTKSVEQATALVSLAFRAAEGSGQEFATVAESLSQLMQGRALGAATALGVQFKRTGDEVRDAQTALEEAFKRWPEKVADIDDMQNALDRSTAAWARLSRAVGKDFGAAVTAGKEYLAKTVETLYVLAKYSSLIGAAQETGDLRIRLKSIWTEATEAVKDFEAEVANVDPVMAKFLAEQNKINALKATIAGNRPDKSAEDAAKQRERIADAEFELARIRAQDMAQIQKDLDDEITKRQEAAADRRLGIMQHEIEQAAANAKTREELEGQLQDVLISTAEQGSAERRDAELAALQSWYAKQQMLAAQNAQALLIIDKIYVTRKKAIEDGFNEAQKKIDQAKKDQAYQTNMELIHMSLNALGIIFDDNKAVAIAQALINTYEGVTKAFSQGGMLGFVTGALILAAGMEQVRRIRSTTPGSSGGATSIGGSTGGGSDAASMRGGVSKIALTGPNTASAHEIVTAGAPDMGSVRAASAGGGITINYHGTVIDSERAERKLSRRLKIADRRDQVRQVR